VKCRGSTLQRKPSEFEREDVEIQEMNIIYSRSRHHGATFWRSKKKEKKKESVGSRKKRARDDEIEIEKNGKDDDYEKRLHLQSRTVPTIDIRGTNEESITDAHFHS
jgi:glutaredoxin